MSLAKIDLSEVKVVGSGSSLGGESPELPIDGYPLLAWTDNHEKHGDRVFTEDGAASVEAIALDLAVSPDFEVLAIKHKTTQDHVRQAIDYALAAGFLGV